jgi:hypothetical protein
MSTSWRMPVEVISPPVSGCSEHSSRATTLRGRVQLFAWYMKLVWVRSFASLLAA